jgi:outer membrane protein assembly factor BamB
MSHVVCFVLSLLLHVTGHADSVDQAIKASGVRGGLVVHIGCGNGRLTPALRLNERYVVHGLDTSPEAVRTAREHILSLGLYGPVSVDSFDGRTLPYADDLVNIVVCEQPTDVSMEEIMRVLCPLGVACVKSGDRWRFEKKAWPEEIDEWTHVQHGPDGNAVSEDTRVGPPRHLRWIHDPKWSRHHNITPSISCFASARGRVFYVVDETPTGLGPTTPERWALVARDAFNGTFLWRRPLTEWGHHAWAEWKGGYAERFNHPVLSRRLVAVNDIVYATLGYRSPLVALDASTGQRLWQSPLHATVDEVVVDGEGLYASSYEDLQSPVLASDAAVEKRVVACDSATGKIRWTSAGGYVGVCPKTDDLKYIGHLFLVVGKECVFLLDQGDVVALDKRSGREAWRASCPGHATMSMRFGMNAAGLCKLLVVDNTLLLLQLTSEDAEPTDRGLKQAWDRPTAARLRAYDATTGAIRWTVPCGNWGHYSLPELFVIDGRIWVHQRESLEIAGLNLETGEKEVSRSTRDAFTNQHHHRCYENRATSKYLITSYRGLEYLPWNSSETDHNHWVRSVCQLGAFPCNGMTYALPHPCDCYITSKLNGFLALSADTHDRSADTHEADRADRLAKGPAYGCLLRDVSEIDASPQWPTYRCDSARSSATTSQISGAVQQIWATDLKTESLTAPVVSDGMVLVASKTSDSVYALDARSGTRLWRYTAGGPIDSPPTIYRGMVFFGSNDGWVYCLRLHDGALAWRFRAAPSEQRMSAFGRIESCWPVHGSVLVEDDMVYVVGGRSSYLDGGFHKYRLDVATGSVVDQDRIHSTPGMKTDWGRSPDVDYGLLSDILVSDGKRIFMRQRGIFGPQYEGKVWDEHLTSWGGFLDDTWFNRTVWLLDGTPYGELLAFNADTVFGIRAYDQRGAHPHFNAGEEGYLLFAADRRQDLTNRKPLISHVSKHPKKTKWAHRIPVRVTSLALTPGALLAAGTRDVIDEGSDDPLATYRGQRGGLLMAFSPDDGELQWEVPLVSASCYDALAVAQRCVFISQRNGTLLCLGPMQSQTVQVEKTP